MCNVIEKNDGKNKLYAFAAKRDMSVCTEQVGRRVDWQKCRDSVDALRTGWEEVGKQSQKGEEKRVQEK